MNNLSSMCGVDVSLNDQNKLVISKGLSGGEFSKRSLLDLKEVVKDQNSLGENRDLYYMYRDIHRDGDEKSIRGNHLRFDMTVILPGMIGEEYTKTLGHYHPDKIGQGLSYPEVYEVVSGRAFYLLQKAKRGEGGIDFDRIDECYLIEVKAGEKAVMPPDFGHITINIDREPLVMSNWVCDQFSSDYTEIVKHRGGAYYIVKDDDKYQSIKNDKYHSLPDLIIGRPKEQPDLALYFGKPMYMTGLEEVEKLKYISSPEKFVSQLTPKQLFKY